MPLDFGELPPSNKRGAGLIAWTQEANELRARPGEWALFTTRPTAKQASTMAANIRNARLAAFHPAGAFEAAARGNDVWVRYVGGAT